MLPDATFHEIHPAQQVDNGDDYGWWTVFNSIFMVHTAGVAYLGQLSEAKNRKPGLNLRLKWPNLCTERHQESSPKIPHQAHASKASPTPKQDHTAASGEKYSN